MKRSSSVSQSEYIFETLKRMIVRLELIPGQVINENAIAEQLGVSRMPIREANIRLSREYLIGVYPQKGTYVTKIDVNFVRELIYMRHVLECNILRNICEHKAFNRSRMDKIMLLQKMAVDNNNIDEFIELDDRFHQELFAIENHDAIWTTLSATRANYNRYRYVDMCIPDTIRETYASHQRIIDLLEKNNYNELYQECYKHHDCDMETKDIMIEKYPEYFVL